MRPPSRTIRKTGNSPGPAGRQARGALWRPRAGRRRRRTGHFGAGTRNDVASMLFGGGGEPQRWAIVAAAATSVGHCCGCAARLSSIDVPSLRLRLRLRRRLRFVGGHGDSRQADTKPAITSVTRGTGGDRKFRDQPSRRPQPAPTEPQVHPGASRPGAQGRQARAPEAARQHSPPQDRQPVTFSDELTAEPDSIWPPTGKACPRI